ncbi:XRE family transcriptional regulator [Parapedobacter indicus]|uniref:Helix-turn-helix n=1 Tax=Parapedobacter indicus TaxID=1477437 RepID=A0A1I3UYV1_9SPHI|nr:helix-turn-helix domain-containing protein [Parapedobacter indicus]PPK99041.1 helix-turn-helix protein [Parapedobacter indicus]SFJ87859.1 Helix-turn-helix [Parapedobacter indicus]
MENNSQKLLRLREVIRDLGLKDDNEFATRIELGKSYLSEILSGKKNVPKTMAARLYKHLGVNIDWFESGEGEKYLNKNTGIAKGQSYTIEDVDNSKTKFLDLKDGTMIMITPLVQEYAYAGYLAGFQDPQYIEELPKHTIIVSKRHSGNYQSFEVVGDSMTTNEPELMRDNIYDGNVVTGREILKHHWRYKLHMHRFPDYVIVHKTDGILVKRMVAHDIETGVVTLRSINPNKELYPDFEVNLDDVHQIFNIVKVSQDR